MCLWRVATPRIDSIFPGISAQLTGGEIAIVSGFQDDFSNIKAESQTYD